MELQGARVLVVGATGVLGGAITAELVGREQVQAPGRVQGGASTVLFEAYDPASKAALSASRRAW